MSATTIAEFGAKVPRIRPPSLGEEEAAIAANITEFVKTFAAEFREAAKTYVGRSNVGGSNGLHRQIR
ncbi:hypothetical protein [Bradyrhizobium sp. WU425]|uniref:hypothetical protein n=1 Tax=Bradyrhizobium sp. WU425 TaxID=187029 RepID=UPI001E49737F|nr:hypothetical protein [Bradyrhizobium canariense]UFW71305.1 hypothetical protein BcanWU425_32300 [Bradyrhizobium canariense]